MLKLVSQQALTVLVAAYLSVGCATHAADNQRLLRRIDQSRRAALENRQQIAQLQARLAEVEQRQPPPPEAPGSADLKPLLARLDLMIAQNQSLLQNANAASAESPDLAKPPCGPDADAKQQLRYWAERLRANPPRSHGGLSLEESRALNVLLREERDLDLMNPWQSR
jgi:hypothetical protein